MRTLFKMSYTYTSVTKLMSFKYLLISLKTDEVVVLRLIEEDIRSFLRGERCAIVRGSCRSNK